MGKPIYPNWRSNSLTSLQKIAKRTIEKGNFLENSDKLAQVLANPESIKHRHIGPKEDDLEK